MKSEKVDRKMERNKLNIKFMISKQKQMESNDFMKSEKVDRQIDRNQLD